MAEGVGPGANCTGHRLAEGVGSGRWSGSEGIMLFNAWNDTFDSCTLTSGSELWLFLLSVDVTHSCVQSVSGDLGGCVCASTWNETRVELESATRQVRGRMRRHYTDGRHPRLGHFYVIYFNLLMCIPSPHTPQKNLIVDSNLAGCNLNGIWMTSPCHMGTYNH